MILKMKYLLLLITFHASSSETGIRSNSLKTEDKNYTASGHLAWNISTSDLAIICKHKIHKSYFFACTASGFNFTTTKERFLLFMNSDKNLAYVNKEDSLFEGYYQAVQGQWHELDYASLTIALKANKANPFAVSKSRISVEYYCCCGVGCVAINSKNSTIANVVYHSKLESDSDRYDLSTSEKPTSGHSNKSEVSAESVFQLFSIFNECGTINYDLKARRLCQRPDSFIYCETCKDACNEVAEDKNKPNECNCSNFNRKTIYCKTPTTEPVETKNNVLIPQHTETNVANVGLQGISGNSSSSQQNTLSHNSPQKSLPPTMLPLIPTPGTSKRDPTHSSCPCEHGGFCTNNALKTSCNCPDGYLGERCEQIECSRSNCVNGACLNNKCYCTPGFTGDFCEKDINECNPDPCHKNWTVRCENLINSFSCICLPGYTSILCDVNIDDCEYNTCLNGAECVDGVDSYSCKCAAGFDGLNCENNINECVEDRDEAKCFNNGTCIDKINGFDCNCDTTGFEGARCEQNIDDCTPNSCQHGGTCVDKINGYMCNCYSGYTGYNCEQDIKECVLNNAIHQNGSLTNATSPCVEGRCFEFSNESLYDSSAWDHGILPNEFATEFSYLNAAGYFCQCPDGFQGKNCEINLNECELPDGTTPCKKGKCVDGRNNYTCECQAGYQSRNCDIEINECASAPCSQGGTCLDKVADFECVCPEGYGSKDCSVELTGCVPQNPCSNAGTCIPLYKNGQQHFGCTCQSGYSGSLCEIITSMSFKGSNYITVSSNDENYRSGKYEMEFKFKTTLSNVLVAVGQGITYFMLTLTDGRLNLQSSLLNSLKGISSGTNLSNSEWHKVWILVNETHIALAANVEQTIHQISDNDKAQGETGFNMTVLGGATPLLSFLNKQNLNFFVGCVQDAKINGKSVFIPKDTNTNIKIVNDVKVGCTRKEQCKPLNPCLNGGLCTDLWQKYQCQCHRPFLGNKCEFQYKPGTFGNEKTNMSVAQVKIASNVSRQFSSSFDISMFVRTRESRGTIFYLGDDTKENGLFIEARVEEDGQLGVLSKLDEVKAETYTVGGIQINNGIPHLISAQKEKGLVKICINGTEHFRKSVKENVQFNPTIMLIGGVLPNKREKNETLDFANSTAPLTLTKLHRAIQMKLFKGVIQDVRVNLNSTDMTPNSSSQHHFVVEFFPLNATLRHSMGESLGDVSLYGDVLEGVISDETCANNPCLNGGTCQTTWNDFECSCVENVYDGKTCAVLLRCAMVKCPPGSECRNINATGFECIAVAGLNGRETIYPRYRLKSNETKNLNFHQISFRYRSRKGGSVICLSGGSTTIKVDLELEVFVSNRTDCISVYLNSVRHRFSVTNGLDGEWHKVELGFDGNNNLALKFDGRKQENEIGKSTVDFHMSSTSFNDVVLSPSAQIVVGSYMPECSLAGNSSSLQNSLPQSDSPYNAFFKGCLAEVKIGSYELPFVSPEMLYEINENNISLVETTAQTAFYIENSATLHLGCVLCYEDECRYGGKCVDPAKVYDCACKDGYRGSLCETNIDECVDNLCTQGSSCIDQVANYTCVCRKGFTGWLCNEDEDECNSVPCKNGGFCLNLPPDDGFYKCKCTDDYTGENCDRRKLSICQPGNKPCENGAKCRTIPMRPDGVSIVCECPAGFEGAVCEKQIDHCANVTCDNGGTCVNALVGFQCLCMPGWEGRKCEINRNECILSLRKGVSACENNGTCIDGINEFTCDCSGTGYTGRNCEEDLDECESQITQDECFKVDGRICVNIPGSFDCRCSPTFCGSRCNISDPCQQQKPDGICKNGGKCVPMCDEGPDQWICKCADGFEGQTCSDTLISKREQALIIALILISIALVIAAITAIIFSAKLKTLQARTFGGLAYTPSQHKRTYSRLQVPNVLKTPTPERLI